MNFIKAFRKQISTIRIRQNQLPDSNILRELFVSIKRIIRSNQILYSAPNTYTDEELFLGLRIRDKEITAYISREYRPMIRYLIFRMGGGADDAKDIFQDGLAILINMADDPEYELKSSVKTLLYAVCRNQWQYRLRVIRRTVPLQRLDKEPAVHPEFEEESDWVQYEEIFWNVFSSIPPTCRGILLLYFREFSNSKIAEILKVQVGYLKKRKSECKRTFIERITSQGEFHRLRSTEIDQYK